MNKTGYRWIILMLSILVVLGFGRFEFITLIFGAGQALGPFTAGWIAGTTGTIRPVFFVTAGAAALGTAGSLLMKRSTGPKHPPSS